jgi:hypothetical protein
VCSTVPMRSVRFLLSLLVLAGLVLASLGAQQEHFASFDSAACSADALSAPFTGTERVTQVVSFGCENGWSFLWATIGTGEHAVGVTEVLHLNESRQRWQVSSRLKVCTPKVLPTFIYRQGCFSN